MSYCDSLGVQLEADDVAASWPHHVPQPDPVEAAIELQWDAAFAAESGSDRSACFALFRLACWLADNPERAAEARKAGAL